MKPAFTLPLTPPQRRAYAGAVCRVLRQPLRHSQRLLNSRPRMTSAPPDECDGDPDPRAGGAVIGNRVCIEYCIGCRWGLRASWMATELLVTFGDGTLGEVAVRPSPRSGTFRIWVVREEDGCEVRIWCRKADGGFPELKEIKRRVRDLLKPEQDLGHSDDQASR